MSRPRKGIVVLLSDFGTRDWYAACLKAVMLSKNPSLALIDITHDIPPQDILTGASVLANAMPCFPKETVFLAVVDPGVGTSRRLIAARVGSWWVVCPDNGLLSLVLKQARLGAVVELTNKTYWRKPTSATFHGRDILAPAAAHLACGGDWRRLGKPVRRITELKRPEPSRLHNGLRGRITHVDHFGNLITNLKIPDKAKREKLSMQCRYRQRCFRVVSSYAHGNPGEVIALEGSSGFIELAVRNDSAAKLLGAKRGEPIGLISSHPSRMRNAA